MKIRTKKANSFFSFLLALSIALLRSSQVISMSYFVILSLTCRTLFIITSFFLLLSFVVVFRTISWEFLPLCRVDCYSILFNLRSPKSLQQANKASFHKHLVTSKLQSRQLNNFLRWYFFMRHARLFYVKVSRSVGYARIFSRCFFGNCISQIFRSIEVMPSFFRHYPLMLIVYRGLVFLLSPSHSIKK